MTLIDDVPARGSYFSPRRLAHVNFWVRDVEAVARFYREVVGCAEAYRRPMIQGIFMTNGNTYHDLAFIDVDGPIGRGNQPGLHHFAFELSTEIEMVEGFERAQSDSWTFAYTMSADVAHSVYGEDPDGNSFEVYADVYEDFRARRSGVIGVKPGWKPRDTEPVERPCFPANPTIIPVEDSVFRMKRTAHVCLVAKNYEALIDHYVGLVGLNPVFGGKRSEFTVLSGSLGEWNLSIFREALGRSAGLHHTGFETFSEADLDRALSQSHEKVIALDAVVDHPIRRSIFLRDPDGQRLQVFIDRDRSVERLRGIRAEEALTIL